ncbi:helix-turn-helix transcriptional regulator [Lysinibacillus sp. NPDC059133]|uniref:helix-turn-helix transcriptional regulator n=1 Tax=Lysinibacillus sp. NPDC059133 TaxID=3346737 RepID=UPI0036B66702
MRERFDLTQEDLAREIDISRQTIISLEKEHFSPSIILAFKLTKLFNCQIENIFIY